MSFDSNLDRRQFFGVAALSLAASRLHSLGTAPGSKLVNPSVLKQVKAGVLNVGYMESGPPSGPVVLLLHGWPYDVHAFDDVAASLSTEGYRVIVPYLRGYGTTRFLSDDTTRNGQQSAFAQDAIALMDALNIKQAIVGGFDWGSRTAAIMGALYPERCSALVLVSGYLIVNLAANQQPLPPRAELGWWYQYYFATERGRVGYGKNVSDFNKLIWQLASPSWKFDDATFNRSAASFVNPDHVAIVIHNYRWRLELAPGEPKYDQLEMQLALGPSISVPTITMASDFDGVAADGAAYAKRFTGRYSHRILTGIGHNVPQEAPAAFTQAILDADRLVSTR